MVSRNVMLATEAGLGAGETPIFPIHIFKVKEGVNYNPGDPNYGSVQTGDSCFGKTAVSEFLVSWTRRLNLQYYNPGHPDTECAIWAVGQGYWPTITTRNMRS